MDKLLTRLERRFGWLAVPNITMALVLGQVAAYVLSYTRPEVAQRLVLLPRLVLQGEAWRLVTFLFYPPITNPVFAFFGWYMLFLMGTALEGHWGAFRYNVYLLIGYIATVLATFTVPGEIGTNIYLLGSIFLAFAALWPNFELMLFFVLPVKIKWLALLTWIGYFYTAATGDWEHRALVLAATCNFFLFFYREVWGRIRSGKRRMDYQRRQQRIDAAPKLVHRCTICGATRETEPKLEFRYCSKCSGSHEYCERHLRDHEHVVVASADQK